MGNALYRVAFHTSCISFNSMSGWMGVVLKKNSVLCAPEYHDDHPVSLPILLSPFSSFHWLTFHLQL